MVFVIFTCLLTNFISIMTRIIAPLLLLACMLLAAAPAHAQNADDLRGYWMPSLGSSIVMIYKGTDGKYYGRVEYLREDRAYENGKPRVDKNNPNEQYRNIPILGYRMLKKFEYNSEDKKWINGTIYDPNNGSIYDCEITMVRDSKGNPYKLEVRGYIGTSLFGRTDEWKLVNPANYTKGWVKFQSGQ